MTEHAAGWHPGDGGPGSGLDVEYRLSRAYRRPMLAWFILMAAVAAAVESSSMFRAFAPVFGALAVYFGGSYLWRGRFRTRVTSRGIEVRGYFNHFVPWDQVRDIEVRVGSDRMGLGADWRVPGPRASLPSTGSGRSREVSIVVVRADGHEARLRAPLASDRAPDPYFDDKVKQLGQLWARYGRGVIAS